MTELIHLAEASGITIEYCCLPLNGSISVQDDDGDFIIMDWALSKWSTTAKVHLAHEIGHCVCGAFYNPYSSFDIRQKHEYRADKWAIKKLIPVDELDEAVAAGYTELWDLADYFGVTEEFMKKAVCWYTHGNLAAELYF